MDFVKVVHVTYCGGKTPLPMGRLAFIDRRIFFEYTPEFLHSGLELSPFKLPLKPGIFTCKEHIFDGLFGVFNDSLPDGWGRLLLDRKLTKVGINPQTLTPLDRLCYVGKGGMGALQYQPEIEEKKKFNLLTDLDLIADECLQFLENKGDQYVEDLLVMNGSSAGARPKIVVSLLPDQKGFKTSQPPYHNEWIIKFRSFLDPEDIGPLEYAYHLMASAAGVDVPQAKLFKSRKCGGHFGVKRFDRQEHRILHMHTVSGLLHADHRLPSLDYGTLMKATLWLTKDIREGEKLLRLAAFNVFAHNRDDHAKNFSFLMDENGTWRLSPAYDLTYSYGPGGEHCTTVMGEGKYPSSSSLLKLAQVADIKPEKATQIIHHVKEAVVNWPRFAKEAEVTSRSMESIEAELAKIL
jgi:serine/threonine-protein kinase HipA